MSTNIAELALGWAAGARAIFIAAPYIKYEAIVRLLSAAAVDASVICVTRWTPQDIAFGATDTECRTFVLARGGKFLIHPALHAKFYRFDDIVLVGSANLTASGMGWSPTSNLEILCQPGADFDVDQFWTTLMADTREVLDTEFSYWAEMEQLRPGAIKDSGRVHGPPRDWRPTTREYGNLELGYLDRWPDIPSSDERGRASRDLDALAVPAGLSLSQFRTWATTSVLAALYTHDVMRFQYLDQITASRELAQLYRLSDIDARRQMETVHNWLRELAPELLPSSETE